MFEPTAEILSIGNEILQGDLPDTNSYWLCRQLATRGLRVARITTLPDMPEVIGEAVVATLARHPALIITCGGLGPTADDVTLASVAQAIGRPLEESAAALEMVQEFYAGLYALGEVDTPEITPARYKMAVLPAGGQPLANAVGAAPGVLLVEDRTGIACLPGVPAEMKAIFEGTLWPLLAGGLSAPVFVERVIPTDCPDESIMAPAVDGVAARHPHVYVKSRAQVYRSGQPTFVTLTARTSSEGEAAALLDAAEADLRQALAAVGITAGPSDPTYPTSAAFAPLAPGLPGETTVRPENANKDT